MKLNGIKNLSKERVLSELLKKLKLENFLKIFKNKKLFEIFNLVFPEFKNIYRLKNFMLISNRIKKSEILLLSILLVDLKGNHEYFCHKYKVSNKIRDHLNLIGSYFKDSKIDKEFFKKRLKSNLYNIGIDNFKILFCLNLLDKKTILAKDNDFFKAIDKISIPQFPFDGKFLIKRGIQEGKKNGAILKRRKNFGREIILIYL